MHPNREFLRSPIDAAATAGRAGRDHKLATRLRAVGINPYKGGPPITLVDLASEGSLSEPQGLELRHSKLFNSQAATVAYGLHCDIEAFEKASHPTNVVHIVIRPPIDLRSKDEEKLLLLDDEGRCAIRNLRLAQKTFNHVVQRAIAELYRKELLEPLLVARHLLPFDGGARFDLHSHVVALMKDGADYAVHEYLVGLFGSARVWTSSVMEPGEVRELSGTANYPIWKLANQDWNEVHDAHLKELFEQCIGLRSTDALGPFRDFRSPDDKTFQTANDDDCDRLVVDEHDPDQDGLAEADICEVEAADVNMETAEVDHERNSRNSSIVDISGYLTSDPDRVPVLLDYHFAWIGMTRRFVARVANYTSFADLEKYYDLSEGVAFAQHHVQATHRYLFKPVKPKRENATEGSATPANRHSQPHQVAAQGRNPVATPETSAAGPLHADKGVSPVATPETSAAGPLHADKGVSPVATPEISAAGPLHADKGVSPVATPEISAAGPLHADKGVSPVATPEISAAGPLHADKGVSPVATPEISAAGPLHADKGVSPVATPETSAAGPLHADKGVSPVATPEISAAGPLHADKGVSPVATPEASAAGPLHPGNATATASRNSGRVASSPAKPKTASPPSQTTCDERLPPSGLSDPRLAELCVELTVRSESGPATATLRFGFPSAAWPQQIAG